jgi:predicted acylesterase/phospholipase RssA
MADSTHVAPEDRYCDLVMKGGITSGVVYPPAICALANHYRFKNIGGTSAGAIAAAITAAAEYRRRMTGSMDGFKLVADLPENLGKPGAHGDVQLLRLFQPDRPGRRLFRILIGSLNAKGTFHRIGAVLRGCIISYWFASVASLAVSVLVFRMSESIHAFVFVLAVSLPLFVGALIYFDVTRRVVGNNYGLCKGMTTNSKAGPALTPWLHNLIQQAAGLPPDEPLTFGHLWKARGGPPVSKNFSTAPRSIDLRMFTTNLSHGRPYIFPHAEPTARLFYRREGLAEYLPPEVLQWFDAHAVDYVPSAGSPGSDPDVAEAQALGLREIPRSEDFPILLAARMSLSFPLLFAAVPLWAIDYEHPRRRRGFQRCLFSDGGISSNFPVHLFDGLIPGWPTFAIDLEAALPDYKDGSQPFLPYTYLQGVADRWTRFDQATNGASRMGGFLMGIVNAMQNWNDNVLSRMPGVRDRVVRVRLQGDEGGMNLNMPKQVIDAVSARGAEAAQGIIARFLGPVPAGTWDGWSFQRWVRLDVLISALSQKTGGMERALGASVPHSVSYDDLIALSRLSAPPGHNAPVTSGQSDALRLLKEALEAIAQEFELHAADYPNSPIPEVDLRVRPPL